MNDDRLHRWLADSPLNLAVFRITVGAVVLYAHQISDTARGAAALPDAVRTPPVGLEWAIGTVPVTADLAAGAYYGLMGAAVTGTVGFMSQTSFAAVSVLALYLWGIPQFVGDVFHYHHLLWFGTLLAASPCGDALSIDRWWQRRRGRPEPPDAGLAYGIPIRAAWLLIGMIYFFPGLWKLLTSGVTWFWSDNLRNHMYAKWAQQPDFEPLFRIDRYPLGYRLAGLGVVLFELSFGVAVWFRRIRPWTVAAAVLFHMGTRVFMGLTFPALWLCYTCFFDWRPVAAKLRRVLPALRTSAPSPDGLPAARRRTAIPAFLAAGVLLTGAFTFGAAGISDGWPFACYPKFDRRVPARLPAMDVVLVHRGGETTKVPPRWMFPGGRTQRYWAFAWSLIGSHPRARASQERLRSFWHTVRDTPPLRRARRDATAVRIYRTTISTIPERLGETLERHLVGTVRLNPAASGGRVP